MLRERSVCCTALAEQGKLAAYLHLGNSNQQSNAPPLRQRLLHGSNAGFDPGPVKKGGDRKYSFERRALRAITTWARVVFSDRGNHIVYIIMTGT